MKQQKPRIRLRSLPILCALDRDIRRWNRRGWLSLQAAPSDLFDGWLNRRELDDLIRRRLLWVVPTGEREDGRGRDLCGTTWTVILTPRAIQAFWPNRIALPKPRSNHAKNTGAADT